MKAREETLDWLRSYYRLIDDGRYDECLEYFTPDTELRIVHHPAVKGAETIVNGMRNGLSLVKSIRHDILNAWEEDDGTIIFEVEATYTMPDDAVIVVPGVVIADVENGKFRAQRITADLTTVYGRGR